MVAQEIWAASVTYVAISNVISLIPTVVLVILKLLEDQTVLTLFVERSLLFIFIYFIFNYFIFIYFIFISFGETLFIFQKM